MQISTIGLVLAKNVFQVHGIDAAGKVALTKKLRRSQAHTSPTGRRYTCISASTSGNGVIG